jgi:hypothetical protein
MGAESAATSTNGVYGKLRACDARDVLLPPSMVSVLGTEGGPVREVAHPHTSAPE